MCRCPQSSVTGDAQARTPQITERRRVHAHAIEKCMRTRNAQAHSTSRATERRRAQAHALRNWKRSAPGDESGDWVQTYTTDSAVRSGAVRLYIIRLYSKGNRVVKGNLVDNGNAANSHYRKCFAAGTFSSKSARAWILWR